MTRHVTSRQRSPIKKQKAKVAVLFGFNLSDEDDVGYFGKDLSIVKDRADAKEFSLKKKKASGFASPQKWCDFINEDDTLNHGYKFHVVNCFQAES